MLLNHTLTTHTEVCGYRFISTLWFRCTGSLFGFGMVMLHTVVLVPRHEISTGIWIY
jgi:hypothetical protein